MGIRIATVAGAEQVGAGVKALLQAPDDPIHVHLHELARGQTLSLPALATDRMAYVLGGTVEAGGQTLAAGSSIIVERGASGEVRGAGEGAQVLLFTGARSPSKVRAGGHVHLLPTDQVPRIDSLPGVPGVAGALHADAACPTCEVWLHENSMGGVDEAAALARGSSGVHAHSEDEVIFVTGGAMRLGTQLHGPGSAVAISADSFYSFTPGPDGLTFVNFRAAVPTDVKFRGGGTADELGYWRECSARLRYLEPA